MALLLGYNQVLFHQEVHGFLPIYFPRIFTISGKTTCFHGKGLIVKSLFDILRTEKQGESKLMYMPLFEIVSIMCMALVLFQKHVLLQLIQIYINGTCYGFMSLMNA